MGVPMVLSLGSLESAGYVDDHTKKMKKHRIRIYLLKNVAVKNGNILRIYLRLYLRIY